MTVKYYFKHFLWGLIPVSIMIYQWMTESHTEKLLMMLIFSVVHALLYPLSRLAIEKFALTFTTKEFWDRDFFTNTTGGSLEAILFIFCFVAAIPLSLAFILWTIFSPPNQK